MVTQNIAELLDIYKEDYTPPHKFLKELENKKKVMRVAKCLAKSFLKSIEPHLKLYRKAQDDNSHLIFLENEFVIQGFRASIDLALIYDKVKDRNDNDYNMDNPPTVETLDGLMFEILSEACYILQHDNDLANQIYLSLNKEERKFDFKEAVNIVKQSVDKYQHSFMGKGSREKKVSNLLKEMGNDTRLVNQMVSIGDRAHDIGANINDNGDLTKKFGVSDKDFNNIKGIIEKNKKKFKKHLRDEFGDELDDDIKEKLDDI